MFRLDFDCVPEIAYILLLVRDITSPAWGAAILTCSLGQTRSHRATKSVCWEWRWHQTSVLRTAATLVHAFVTSRIDYCNAVLAGTPKVTTDKLQRVMNAAARVVSDTQKFDRGLSQLLHEDLHWLDVPQRIEYKLSVLVHRCQYGSAPPYLKDCCTSVADVPGRQHLRSASFKRQLKTFLFSRTLGLAYPAHKRFFDNALYKFTFTLLTYLLTYLWKSKTPYAYRPKNLTYPQKQTTKPCNMNKDWFS